MEKWQGDPRQGVDNVISFCLIGPKELSSGWHIVEKVSHFYDSSSWTTDFIN
jgi:hypothetical protein